LIDERGSLFDAALVNQIRGLLVEYGIVMQKGVTVVRRAIPGILEDGENGLSDLSRECSAELYAELVALDEKIACYEKKLVRINQTHDACQRLDEINGVGAVTATATYAAVGQGRDFRNGRHFSAWLGLVPKQHSSGGKDTLLGN